MTTPEIRPFHVRMTCISTLVGFLLLNFQGNFLLASGSRVEQELLSRLTIGYNRQLRPVKRPNEPVRVTLSVSLVEVLGLDENLNHITVKLWVALKWEDEYLTWNVEQYGGVKRLNFATGSTNAKIWTPDVVLHNAIKTDTNSVDADAVATSDGVVTWVRPFVYTVSSSHEFRGNSWTAAFRFASWTYDSSLLDLQVSAPVAADAAGDKATRGGSATDGGAGQGGGVGGTVAVRMDTENFVPSDQWALLENQGRLETTQYPCCPNEPYTSVNYVLKLRKKIGPSLLGRRG